MVNTTSPRRKPRENQFPFDLGVKGRKTGLTVPDSGIRDEYGLEPMDHLFVSPDKPAKSDRLQRSGAERNANATISDEEDMDIGQSTIPEPTAVLTERKRASMRMPPPKSKSPIKTFLQSPARRHPSLGPLSSPTRGSIVRSNRMNIPVSVNRRLDFSVDNLDQRTERPTLTSSPPKRNGLQTPSANSVKAKLSNLPRFSPRGMQHVTLSRMVSGQNEDPEAERDDVIYNEEHSYQPMDLDDNGSDDQIIYTENASSGGTPEVELSSPLQAIKKAGKSARESLQKGVKRKQAADNPAEIPAETSTEAHNERADGDVEERPTKRARGRPRKTETAKANHIRLPQPKIVEKHKSSVQNTSSPAEVQRGPPRPKNSRGLYILRRETPEEVFQSRSGRHVIRPLAYWKNEMVVYGDDEEADGDASFLLPTIKEVIRKDQIEEPKARGHKRGAKSGGKSKKRKQDIESEEDDELVEPWELEPGRINGPVRMWNPEDPGGDDSPETEDEIALSSAAIITKDIPGASFRFAKTLTLGFFGSGIVDLPPGSIKKPNSSLRMQLVFFVHTGRVSVTVNDNSFRIGKGGMWQVPRGNSYSIENDYEKPSRIFFAQGRMVVEDLDSK